MNAMPDRQPFRDVAWLAAALLAAVTLVAWPTFGTRPMGDDFGMPLYASLQAERGGFASLLLPGQALRYRPLEAVTMYAAQHLPLGSMLVRVRLLHLASFGLYLLAVLNFGRLLGLARGPLVVAGVALAFHPVQVACFGGMDNFSVHVLVAIMFAGASLLLALDGRPAVVAGVTFLTAILASCFKEYGYGTALLAPLVVLSFHARRPLTMAAVAFVAGCAAVLLHQALRRLLMPEGVAPALPDAGGRLAMIAGNVALYAVGITLYGSTLELMTRPGLAVKAASLALIGLYVAFVASGITLLLRREGRERRDAMPAAAATTWTRRVAFLVLCVVPFTFPNVVMLRISEVYLPGVVALASLLVAVAYVGYAPVMRRGAGRWVIVAAGAVLLASAVWSTRGKAVALRHAGERADAILAALDRAIPADRRDGRVAVLHLADENAARGYSIYRASDDVACSLPGALRWRRPDTRIVVDSHTVRSVADFDRGPYDAVYLWRSTPGVVEVIKPDRRGETSGSPVPP